MVKQGLAHFFSYSVRLLLQLVLPGALLFFISSCRNNDSTYRLKISQFHTTQPLTNETSLEPLKAILRKRLQDYGMSKWEFSIEREGSSHLVAKISSKYPESAVRYLLTYPGAPFEVFETLPYEEGFAILDSVNQKIGRFSKKSEFEFKGKDDPTERVDSSDINALRANFEAENPLLGLFAFVKQETIENDPHTPVMGYVMEEDTAEVSWWLREFSTLLNQSNVRFLWAKYPQKETSFFALIAIRYAWGGKNPPVDLAVVEAKADNSDGTGFTTTLSLRFEEENTADWVFLTSKNVGYALALCENGKVLSWPRVQSAITTPEVVISGLEPDEAKEMAEKYRLGHLPFRVSLN